MMRHCVTEVSGKSSGIRFVQGFARIGGGLGAWHYLWYYYYRLIKYLS